MSATPITLPEGRAEPRHSCPKCGNRTRFVAHSERAAEDCCEVWVACICGFDPTANMWGGRLEDAWGGIHAGTVTGALDCWDDAIDATNLRTPTPTGGSDA